MLYRNLGNTGIKISVFSFGNWINGASPEQEKLQIELFKEAYKNGINFFDTAEVYGYGQAEKQLGLALKEIKAPRESLVISTKLFWGSNNPSTNFNSIGLSRKHLISGMKASLSRLQLEYVDIVFCHRPDHEVSLEEVCRSMSWIIDQGYALYWGTSEWSPAYIAASIEICKRLGLNKPVVEQPQYNILNRNRFEKEYREIFELYGYATTVWSPLASGFLSGKYNEGIRPEDSRLKNDSEFSGIYDNLVKNNPNIFAKLSKLKQLSEKLGYTQAQLALAWVAANKDVTTCILGASKVSQIKENLKALEILKQWTPELDKEISEIFENDVEPNIMYRERVPSYKMRPNRRIEVLYIKNNN